MPGPRFLLDAMPRRADRSTGSIRVVRGRTAASGSRRAGSALSRRSSTGTGLRRHRFAPDRSNGRRWIVLSTPPPVNSVTTNTSPSVCCAAERQPAGRAQPTSPWKNQKPTGGSAVRVALGAKYMFVAVRSLIRDGIRVHHVVLLLTLLSRLHCQPEIGRVSLLPVAYVDPSLVMKEPPVGVEWTKSILEARIGETGRQ